MTYVTVRLVVTMEIVLAVKAVKLGQNHLLVSTFAGVGYTYF